MFLRSQIRKKDGKEHTLLECGGKQTLHAIGRGRINGRCSTLASSTTPNAPPGARPWSVHTDPAGRETQIALFPARPPRADRRRPRRPHPAGSTFPSAIPANRAAAGWRSNSIGNWPGHSSPNICPPRAKGTRLGSQLSRSRSPSACSRRARSGSCHRDWFERTALADLLGGDFGGAARTTSFTPCSIKCCRIKRKTLRPSA